MSFNGFVGRRDRVPVVPRTVGRSDLIGACAIGAHHCRVRRLPARGRPVDMSERTTMTIVAETDPPVHVTGGVDTRADVHVGAALDQPGRELGWASFPTTPADHT